MTAEDEQNQHQDQDQLDQRLQRLRQLQTRAPAHLAGRILANLPEPTPAEQFLLWLTTSLWRPALAAAVPLMIGFVAGVFGSHPLNDDLAAWYSAEDLVYATFIEEYEHDEI